MIEIKCTQQEKEEIIACLTDPYNYCFIPTDCEKGITCRECLEKNIKWNVTSEKEV